MIRPASTGCSTLHNDWRDRWSFCVGEDDFLIVTPLFLFLASYRGYDAYSDSMVTRLLLCVIPDGREYLGAPKWRHTFNRVFEQLPYPLRKETF